VRFAQGLGDFLTRRATGPVWLLQAVPWVGLIAGAILGAVAYGRVGETALWLPVIMAGLLAAYAATMPETE